MYPPHLQPHSQIDKMLELFDDYRRETALSSSKRRLTSLFAGPTLTPIAVEPVRIQLFE